METSFSLNEIIKYMIQNNMSLDEICNGLNFDRKYIITLLKGIKGDILLSYDYDSFYMLELIDKILYKDKTIRHVVSHIDDEKRKIIINLIEKGYSGVDILNEMSIDERELLYILKTIYYDAIRNKEIFIDINIIKKTINEIVAYLKNRGCTKNKKIIYPCNDNMILDYDGRVIETSSKCQQVFNINEENEFRFIVISDTHFGSVFENIKYLNYVYEYASKNDINYILHAGDLIEGSYDNFARCKEEYKTIDSQIEHVFKDYSYDKNIKNMILLANHDAYSIYHYGVDIAPLLKEREDFQILGYRCAYIKINDRYISLKHEISRLKNNLKDYLTLIDFIGHSHQYRCNYNKTNTRVRIPTLSDMRSNMIVNKGFLVCSINSDNLKVNNFSCEYIDFEHIDRKIIIERTLKK